VTLLAGGAVVANAEGDEKAEERKVVVVRDGKPVAVDEELARELARINKLMNEAAALMERVRLDAERKTDVELRRALEILEQTNRELALLKHKMARSKARVELADGEIEEHFEKDREIIRRFEKDEEIIEGHEEKAEPVEVEEILEGDPIAKHPAPRRRGDVKELLARARKGDPAAKDGLRELMAEIRAVVENEDFEDPRKAIARVDGIRAAAAIRELVERLKRTEAALNADDADLDAGIKRRTALQARIMKIRKLRHEISVCDAKIEACRAAGDGAAVEKLQGDREHLRRKLEALLAGKKKKARAGVTDPPQRRDPDDIK